MTTPSTMTPHRMMPISIGLMSSLSSISPRSPSITSPAFTAVTVLMMFTLPFSILAGMPTADNSPTIGPGANSVGPCSTTMSSGAMSPALAGRPVRVWSSCWNNWEMFNDLECTIIGCWAVSNIVSSCSSGRPASFHARLNSDFFAIVSVMPVRRVLRISSIACAGTPATSTMPMIPSLLSSSVNSPTRSTFHCVALAIMRSPPAP